VNTVVNVRVPLKALNILTSCATISFSGNTTLHGISYIIYEGCLNNEYFLTSMSTARQV